MKKYELTEETKVVFGVILHRIRAIRDFSNVKAGSLGGFIEKEENLDHDSDAWVYGDAIVYGDARVSCKNSIFWIPNIGSRSDTTTFFLCKDKKIYASCGCFFGDLDKFREKVEETHGNNTHGRTYRLAIEMAKAQILIPEEHGI